MVKNQVYPLYGPKYPLFVPVTNPSKPKSKWRPWGAKPPQILSLGGGASESYFRKRESAARASEDRYDDRTESYPRRVDLLPKPTNGEF